MTKAHHEESLGAVREEYTRYFQALEKHPRLLVGQQVPKLDGTEGTETLRDAADAREWQDAVKQILVEEVRGRTTKALDDQKDYLETIHSSIKLFQDNKDLVPGTKDFDVDLANRFAEMAKPYELRVEGKLNGYAIPVQPLIDQIRAQLVKSRAASPAPAAPAAPAAAAPAGTPKPEEQPQAGIPSKAGSSGGTEDFSTLFGTIGLPGLRI